MSTSVEDRPSVNRGCGSGSENALGAGSSSGVFGSGVAAGFSTVNSALSSR